MGSSKRLCLYWLAARCESNCVKEAVGGKVHVCSVDHRAWTKNSTNTCHAKDYTVGITTENHTYMAAQLFAFKILLLNFLQSLTASGLQGMLATNKCRAHG